MISPQHKIDIKALTSEKTKDSLKKLMNFGRQKQISKGICMIQEGQPCKILFLVLEGIFRTFRIDNENNEYTTGFTFKGDLDTSPFAFFYGTFATETIEAITDAKVLVVALDDYNEVRKKHIEVQEAMTLLLASYVETLEVRLHQKRTQTAEEIYHHLKLSQPDQLRKIPLQYIASYLGITKERLSRIRRKKQNF